jgi:hypothetical protein
VTDHWSRSSESAAQLRTETRLPPPCPAVALRDFFGTRKSIVANLGGPPQLKMLIENHHVERLFPVCTLITSDASYKIVSAFAAEAACRAGNNVAEIAGVRVVAINRGQLCGRIDVEVA